MTWREVMEWGAYDKLQAERELERKHRQLHEAEFKQAMADLRRRKGR